MKAISSKEWQFSTTPQRPPIGVKIFTYEIEDGKELRIRMEVGGLMHPYIGDSNYLGDAGKNPAVLPAAKRVAAIVQDELRHQLETNPKMKQANEDVIKYGKPDINIVPGIGSMSIMVTFNPSPIFCDKPYEAITHADMQALGKAVTDRIDAARPEIEKLVADNAHLQPPENPTPQQVRGVEQRLENAWAKSMKILEKTGRHRARADSPKPDYTDN